MRLSCFVIPRSTGGSITLMIGSMAPNRTLDLICVHPTNSSYCIHEYQWECNCSVHSRVSESNQSVTFARAGGDEKCTAASAVATAAAAKKNEG